MTTPALGDRTMTIAARKPGSRAIMVNQMHAVNVAGELAKRIVKILTTRHLRPVRSHGVLRAMQSHHHSCGDYSAPEHRSVAELQQRVARHFIEFASMPPGPNGCKY
jgi:hypothetical protein